MKKIVFSSISALVVLFGMHFPIFSQNQVRTEAENQHITVFLNRAQIDARIKSTVPAGTTKLIVSNVASTADPNSLQIEVKAK